MPKANIKSGEKYNDNPNAYVAESPIHGYGLFARRKIAANEYIGTYQGKATYADGMHVLWLYDEDTGESEGIDGTNEMRFLNHDRPGNAEFWNDELFARRKIKKDEEITFDYQWDE